MRKVIYSISKVSRKNPVKISGIGYITDEDLIIALNSKSNKPYIKVFEDCIKSCGKSNENEFSGHYYEFKEVDLEDERGKITAKEICLEYKIWFKIINN